MQTSVLTLTVCMQRVKAATPAMPTRVRTWEHVYLVEHPTCAPVVLPSLERTVKLLVVVSTSLLCVLLYITHCTLITYIAVFDSLHAVVLGLVQSIGS